MTINLDAIRSCLEGVIPGTMATADLEGTPNVSYLSHVQFVDSEHVALSYQFFNKTRQNLLVNPHAMLAVIDPLTATHYRLTLEYIRTETAGPLFESMKARLAGIASHVGMTGVFKLLGSDIFRVTAIEQVPGETMPPPPPRHNLLASLRQVSETVRAQSDLDTLLNQTLAALAVHFDIPHSMVLLYDEPGSRLFTVASFGYDPSGVGAEIPLGDGVIGVAARERTPIRIGHMTSEYSYSRAIRQNTMQSGLHAALETEIPLAGLPDSRSQLAVPLLSGTRLIGVLYVESTQDLRYSYDDEDALVALGSQLGMAICILQAQSLAEDEAQAASDDAAGAPRGEPVVVRHYPENDSVFLDDDYLIKGVAGSVFWMLMCDFIEKGRTEFTNRELRLDPRVRLPDLSDNLEGRLLLLSRRLVERNACVKLEKTGRGRFRVVAERPLKLAEG
ncbi:GAF domain-containing protein [Massilia arenosa]|uniref:GAF domain-containing protein n=1 Tax=Zemynaea arenosa TaxID=2561931 RepID=A0A4Y9SSN4_9BURK|nr:GAF domain-containing protein [Massilia arenosa]TFW28349.1 GAF domain-containing protein [Massilia arenosa]